MGRGYFGPAAAQAWVSSVERLWMMPSTSIWLGMTIGAAVAGVDVGVGEGDVGDPALDLLEGDPVADLDRLGDRELNAGDHVGDRVLGGEADDQPPSTAVEARIPVASRFSSVNWLSAIATRTRKTTRITSRRRKRRRVLVERETWETAGAMDANLAAEGVGQPLPARLSVRQLGADGPAVLGVLLALGTGVVLAVPAADHRQPARAAT